MNFQMPELPPSEEPVEETPPLRSISTPVPIFVNKVSLNNINLNILGNKIDWQDFSTALSMQGDRLVIAPTALKVINVALASTDETPKKINHRQRHKRQLLMNRAALRVIRTMLRRHQSRL